MNQLGYMLWATLSQYIIRPSDLELAQSFFQAFGDELLNDLFTKGVVYFSGAPTFAGLNVTIPAGLVVFPSGNFATFASQTVAINPGDGTNYRVDRIVLSYSENIDQTAPNKAGITQNLDKFQVASAVAVQGNPYATALTAVPSATPANDIPVLLIPVAPTDVAINTANVSQVDDVACQYAAMKVCGSSTFLMRVNHSLGVVQVSFNGGTSWGPLPQGAVTPGTLAIPNGGSVPLNSGIILDPTRTHFVKIPVSIYRTYNNGTAQEVAAAGDLWCRYKPIAGSWTVDAMLEGNDSGIEFGMTGNQITLTEIDAYTGTAYSGTLNWGAGSYT